MEVELKELLAANDVAKILKDELLRARDVSRILKISESGVYSLKTKGVIPFVQIGSAVRFRLEDVHSLIETNRRVGGATPRPGGGRPRREE